MSNPFQERSSFQIYYQPAVSPSKTTVHIFEIGNVEIANDRG